MAPYLHAGRRNHVTADTQMKKFAWHKQHSAVHQPRYSHSTSRDNRTDCTPISVSQNINSLNVLLTNLKSLKWKRESHSTLRSWSQGAPPSHCAANWGGRHAEADQTRPVQTNDTRQTGLHSTPAQLVAKTRLVPHFCNTAVLTSVSLHSFWTQLCDVHDTLIKHKYIPGVHKRRANTFFTLPPRIYGPLVWKLLPVTLGRLEVVPRILENLLTPDMYT